MNDAQILNAEIPDAELLERGVGRAEADFAESTAAFRGLGMALLLSLPIWLLIAAAIGSAVTR